MKQAKSRVYWLDFLGGLGILGVVLSHSLQGTLRYTGCLGQWIGMFMIFVFFMKVGWLYEERKIRNPEKPDPDLKEFAKRRLILRGKQYIIFSVCVFVADCVWVLIDYKPFLVLAKDIYRTVCLGGIGTLWFLPVITFGEILFYFGKQPKKQNQYLVWGCIVLAFVYTILLNLFYRDSTLFDVVTTPLSVLAKSAFGTLVMMFGGYIRKLSGKYLTDLHIGKRIVLCVLLLVFSLILADTYKVYSDFNHLRMDNTLSFFVWAMLIAGCVMIICEQIYFMGMRVRILETMGTYSLIIMVTHYTIFLPLFRIIIGAVLGNSELAYEAPWDFVVAILVLLAQIPVCWFISRYFPELLGGKKREKSTSAA